MIDMPTHYRVCGCCVSGILACTLEYNYDCGLFDDPFSDKESDVTCPGCLATLKEWEQVDCPPEFLAAADEETLA